MKLRARVWSVFGRIGLLCTLSLAAFASGPAIVTSTGYINGTPLTSHTSATFDSTGASTLIAFVGSHPTWNNQPVSITGVSDNLGNSWQVLTGPTSYLNNSVPMLAAIYYVNAPLTGAQHTVTVTLTNGAPLVLHVFAVSGSDITGPPIYAPITDPGALQATTDVTSQAITAPAGSLLLGWAKNQSTATATALSGFTLDAQSTGFLWAESQTVSSSGTYAAHFSFSTPTGWQTSVVALKPAPASPVASDQAIKTRQAVNITLTASSPTGAPLTYTVLSMPGHGTLSGVAPNVAYTPASGYVGSDAFTFKANDGAADSNVATVSITVLPPDQPPVASDETVSVPAGTVGTITLLASDPDGDPLTYRIITPPAHGQLSGGTGPTWNYTPAAGFTGNDSFTFRANDGTYDSNLAQVTISVSSVAIVQSPAILRSIGYINGTPLTAHTSAAFNTTGASLLVAFVSTNTPWLSQNVTITGVTDSMGNTWQALTGPTIGASATGTPLESAIYYVNNPQTSAQHTVTANLSNGAPLVLHAFAVSGSDISGPPIFSAIADSGSSASTDATSPAVTVPAESLLLGWGKNQNSVTSATAGSGFTLDAAQSTSFLWAESQVVSNAGTYTAQFSFSNPVGWQSAIVAVKPANSTQTPTTTTVTSSASTSNFSDMVRFTATAAANVSSSATPTGTVTFKDGITLLASNVPVSGGLASFAIGSLTVGSHTITADYSGDSAFAASSGSTTQNVNQATSILTWANPADIIYGTALSATQLNATASIAGTLTYSPPIGTILNAGVGQTLSVTFTPQDQVDYAVVTKMVIINVTPANASVTPNAASKMYGAADPTLTGALSGFLSADNVTASYNRTAGESVAGSPYTISATLSPAAALGNYKITYNHAQFTITPANASVTPNAASKVYGAADPMLTGTLSGFLAADNVSAAYSRTAGETVAGSPYAISATLTPAAALGNYKITYNTATFTITKAATTTVVTSTANPSISGQSVTLTAAVMWSANGVPTGSVTFFDNGVALLPVAQLDASAHASYSTSTLTLGTHTITAAYSGGSNFSGSTSPSFAQAVKTATTTNAPTSSLGTSTYGQAITFTVAVNPSNATGTMQFYAGSVPLGTPVPLINGTGALTTTALNAGTSSITAVYSGDTNFVGSTSPAFMQTVNKASTTSGLIMNVALQQYSDPVTFTATLTPSGGAQLPPTAGVIFSMGTQQLNATAVPFVLVNGVPTAILSNYPLVETVAGQMKPGLHSVAATFTGVGSNFTVANVSKSFSIVREDARTYYAGPTTVSTGSSTVSTATIPLQWTIKDITAVPTDPAYDPYPGDITLAQVTFVNRATGATIATVPVTLVPNPNNPNDRTVGIATYNWNVDIGTATSQSYIVGTMVSGYYTRNSTTENATITVSKP